MGAVIGQENTAKKTNQKREACLHLWEESIIFSLTANRNCLGTRGPGLGRTGMPRIFRRGAHNRKLMVIIIRSFPLEGRLGSQGEGRGGDWTRSWGRWHMGRLRWEWEERCRARDMRGSSVSRDCLCSFFGRLELGRGWNRDRPPWGERGFWRKNHLERHGGRRKVNKSKEEPTSTSCNRKAGCYQYVYLRAKSSKKEKGTRKHASLCSSRKSTILYPELPAQVQY